MSVTTILCDPLPDLFHEVAGAEHELLLFDSNLNADDLNRIEAVVAYGHPTVDRALMERLPALKVISNHGVGVDHIDLIAAAEHGVPVGNTPGCLDAATADMTMALMLAAARNVVSGDQFARSPEFTHYDPSLLIGKEVTQATLGIVGMGRIGTEVARRALGFGMRIVYHNRTRRTEVESELGVEYADLNTLLESSDFVSLNCPLTEETHGLIGASELGRMRSDAMLINMARGPVVQTDALLEALTNKTIAAAALDVTDPEPLPRDHPLLKLSNLVITPHLGSASDATRRRMMEMTVDNLNAGLTGNPLPYQITAK